MWEKFKRSRRGRGPGGVFISLSKEGIFRFSLECYEKYMKDYSYVHLLFSRKQEMIAIDLLKEKDVDAFPIRKTKSEKSFTCCCACRAFMKCFDLDFSVSRRFYPTYDGEKKRFEFYIDQEDSE